MKNTSKDRASLAREASYKSFCAPCRSPVSSGRSEVDRPMVHRPLFRRLWYNTKRSIWAFSWSNMYKTWPGNKSGKGKQKKLGKALLCTHSRRNWEAVLWGWCFSRTVWMERGVSIGVLGYTMLPPPNFTFPVSLCYQSPIGSWKYICLSFTIFLSAWCWRLDQLLWITSNISLSSRWLL